MDGLIAEAIRKFFKTEETNINLKKLKGKEKGSFRIRKGDIRLPVEERVKILDVSPFTNDVVYGLYVNNEDLTLC